MHLDLLLMSTLLFVGSTVCEMEMNVTVSPKPQLRKLSCYICQWVDNDQVCGDANFTFGPDQAGHFMINCHICYKKIQYAANNTKIRVLRGCAMDFMSYAPGCQYTRFDDGSYVEICACTKSYCNDNTLDAEKEVVFMPQQMPSSLAEKVQAVNEPCSCIGNASTTVLTSSLFLLICLALSKIVGENIR